MELIDIVKSDYRLLKTIPPEKQSEEMCYEAVKQCGWILEHAYYKTEKVCHAAVKNYPASFQFVPDELKTEALSLFAVNAEWNNIEYVINISEPIAIAAVIKNVQALRYIISNLGESNVSETVYLTAINKNWKVIHYITKSQTKEMVELALNRSWRAIGFILDPTEEMCFKAIDGSWEAIKLIKKRTAAMVQYAAQKNCAALAYPPSMFDTIHGTKPSGK